MRSFTGDNCTVRHEKEVIVRLLGEEKVGSMLRWTKNSLTAYFKGSIRGHSTFRWFGRGLTVGNCTLKGTKEISVGSAGGEA
jgi:hypothetical protein